VYEKAFMRAKVSRLLSNPTGPNSIFCGIYLSSHHHDNAYSEIPVARRKKAGQKECKFFSFSSRILFK
jgi:hypothetical protein